ncbi:hypothetical protein [Halodesulfovibrio sp.]|uniref:hypothetical protein n=1 Tax=Halodesulfovibrio sp. TaxID=1912772 RepID=UPI0025C2A9C6|nr:hypothetical protein [Halodesulfovibrio sp.]
MQAQTGTTGAQTSFGDVMQAQLQQQASQVEMQQHSQLLEQPRSLLLPNANIQVAVSSQCLTTPNPAPLSSSAFCFVI